MADEDAIIPATVTGRDNVNNVRPQNFVVGSHEDTAGRTW